MLESSSPEMGKKISLLEQAREREKQARLKAESLLELKSRELFLAKEELEKQFLSLAQQKSELELLSSVTLLARDHENIKEVLQAFIAAVCKMCQWPLAHVYSPNEENPKLLESLKIWHRLDNIHYEAFEKMSEEIIFSSGVGLPGRVLDTKEAVWIEDLSLEKNFPRSKVACDLGLKAAFGIPIEVFGKLVAICEFFTPNSYQKNFHLLEIVKVATDQLKVALERHQSEKDLEDKYEQLKNTQFQLIQAEKLSSVGQLAAGIAHEINTPTQYIGDNIRFLQDSISEIIDFHQKIKNKILNENAPQKNTLQKFESLFDKIDFDYLSTEMPLAIEQSLEGVKRVSEIVGAMKEFSHPGEQSKSLADLNHAIQTTLTVARNEWKYAAEVETVLDPQIPPLLCLPGELNQVFLNLIVNAAHAIEEKFSGKEIGKIKIQTLLDGPMVEIRISDNGKGIPKHIYDKIFDPFFTTKSVGKGSGQGLAIAYSVIVNKHQGSLTFKSELGEGSEFIIRLPKS